MIQQALFEHVVQPPALQPPAPLACPGCQSKLVDLLPASMREPKGAIVCLDCGQWTDLRGKRDNKVSLPGKP